MEGVARLVTKSDIVFLAKKDKTAQLAAAEKMLSEAWVVLESAIDNGHCGTSGAAATFGRLCSRIVLLLLKKEKEGHETHQFQTLAKIKQAFTTESINLLKGVEMIAGPDDVEFVEAIDGPVHDGISSHDDVSNPQWIARQAGFKVHSLYTQKATSILFKLDELSDEHALFTEVTVAPRAKELLSIKYEHLKFKDFSEYKGAVQERMDCASLTHSMAKAHAGLKIDESRVKVFSALLTLARKHGSKEAKLTAYYLSPNELRAASDFAKEELVLVPVTDLSKLALKSKANAFSVKAGDYTFFLDAPTKIKSNDPAQHSKNAIHAAFWWVHTTEAASEANLVLEQKEQDGFSFPIFTNTKAVKKFAKLCMCDKVEAPAPAKKQRRS